jgi:amidase
VSISEAFDEHDALGLAALVRQGEISAGELLEEAIARTERVNPELNAVITPMYDLGRQALRDGVGDGPFAGVPILLKDILHAYRGVPLTSGSAALRGFVPDQDSEMVARLKRAGFIAFGKTNVPEFGLVAATEPEAFGPARNPWDPTRTPGGSSGGSAAAVASGMVPLASANDGGGSIRIPAAWCGLFGLKPSRGRVPTGPRFGEVWEGAVSDHVLTRTVRDSAAALDALVGPAPGDPYVFAPPERPFLQEVSRPPDPLRIAFCTRSPLGADVDPQCRQAVVQTVELLTDLGHRVEEAEPEIDGAQVAHAYLTMYFGHVAADLREVSRSMGKEAVGKGIEPATRVIGLIGESLSAAEYVDVKRSWNTFSRIMGAFHQKYDLFVTPTTASLPLKVGALAQTRLQRAALKIVNGMRAGRVVRATGLVERLAMENLAPVSFTQLSNLTGQPAMSVPLHWTPDGLPCGVQFVAPVAGEAVLFRLAAQLEAARPWMHRRPRVHAGRGRA